MKLAKLAVLALLLAAGVVRGEAVTVSAAISLTEALAEVGKAYKADGGGEMKVKVGASGQLMEQIRAGAPVDLFISAAPGQVEELAKDGLVVAGTRRVVARNRLVLVVPAGAAAGGVRGFEG